MGVVGQIERQLPAATGEQAIMTGEVADELEMRAEAGVGKHTPGIAADREHLAALDQMMAVELEGVLLFGDAPLVDHRLTVVLASGLQAIELEQSIFG